MDTSEEFCPLFPSLRLAEVVGIRLARLAPARNARAGEEDAEFAYARVSPPGLTEAMIEVEHGGGNYTATPILVSGQQGETRTVFLMGEPRDWPSGAGGGMNRSRRRAYEDDYYGDDEPQAPPMGYARQYAPPPPPPQPTNVPLDGSSFTVPPGGDPSTAMFLQMALALTKSQTEAQAQKLETAATLMQQVPNQLAAAREIEDSLRRRISELEATMRQRDMDAQQALADARTTLQGRVSQLEREVDDYRLRCRQHEEKIMELQRDLVRVKMETEFTERRREAMDELGQIEAQKKALAAAGADQGKAQLLQKAVAILESPVGAAILQKLGVLDALGVSPQDITGGGGGGAPPAAPPPA